MKIEENGWPTLPPHRTYEQQAAALELMVRAAHDFRGTYNVSDYRWFNLRDGDSASPLLFQHFGLLESDYDEKPAFGAYRRLVSELSRREADAAPARLSLRLLAPRGRRCLHPPVRVGLAGPDRVLARRASFYLGRRRVARDTRRPLVAVVRRRAAGTRRRHRLTVLVRLADGRLVRRVKPFTACARP
jgi:hypothetical protein